MSATRKVHTSPLALLGLVTALGYAAVPQPSMDVELGLWEVTTAGDMKGAPQIPASLLQRLTPEQQAKMQAAMARQGGPHKLKECMTAEKRARGFGDHDEDRDTCKSTVSVNTSSEFAASASRDTKLHCRLNGKRQVSGTVDITMTQPDGTTNTMHRTIEAQWQGADCGDIKTSEREK